MRYCKPLLSQEKGVIMPENKKFLLSTIVTVALLVALDVILTRFLSIQTQFLRIGFGFLPVAVAGIAYGPFWGAVTGAVGDILGMIIYPPADYFPGFTLTALLTGVIFGLLLHRRVTIPRTILASALVCLLCNLVLDTLWLDIMYGSGFIALLPARVVKCLINIPIYTILIKIIWGNALSKIPQFKTKTF